PFSTLIDSAPYSAAAAALRFEAGVIVPEGHFSVYEAGLPPLVNQSLIIPRFTAKIWASCAIGANQSRSVPVIQAWAQSLEISSKSACRRDWSRCAATSSRRTSGEMPSSSLMSSALARISPIKSAFCSPEEQLDAVAFLGP